MANLEGWLQGAWCVLQPGSSLAAPPPCPSIPHVCGWIPHAAAWPGCKPLIHSLWLHWASWNQQPWCLDGTSRAPYPHTQPGERQALGSDPERGCCHPNPFHPVASSAPGGFKPSLGGLGSLSSCCVPFPRCSWPLSSLHRNDSSLLSSPAGAAAGPAGWEPTSPKRGSLTWQPPHCEPQSSGQGVQALGCSLVSPVQTLAGHGAKGGGGRTCRPCCGSGHTH